MSRRPVRRPRTARMLPGARRRETSRLTGKTVSRPEFPVSRLGFPVSRPAASPVGAPFMTPGARGAQGVGCISHGGLRVFSGHPGRKRQSSGRHKWRPYVFSVGGCGLRRRSVRMRRAASGVARRGAIYDARCPWGHKVSAAWRTAASAFFAAFRVVSPVIRASQVAPLRF